MPEVWFPGSKDPFRPLNPWGRDMPRVPQRERPQLWQVVVTHKGREIPIGPKCERSMVDHLFEMIEQGIRLGTEHDWSKPHIVAVASEHKPSGLTLGDLLQGKV